MPLRFDKECISYILNTTQGFIIVLDMEKILKQDKQKILAGP
jgi:chemotaxis signal transduction protein